MAEESSQGRSDGGGYRDLYPPKSAKVNFLWGKMTSERLFNSFIHPQKLLYPPKQISGYAPESSRAKAGREGIKGRREDGREEKDGEGWEKAKESRVVPHPKLNPGCATDLQTDRPSPYVTSHSGQLSLAVRLQVGEINTSEI